MTAEIKTRIAVIVVNYGTADLAIAAVDSVLARSHGGHPVEVHLLDNASPGGDGAELAKAHAARGWGAGVTLWRESANHGFGRGNNVVLEALARRADPPDYAFLLNPDATLQNEAVAIMADFLDANPQASVAGARIIRPDGTPVRAAFRFPSMASEFGATICFGPISRLFAGAAVALPVDQPLSRVDWVTGAAVMLRFGAARQAGFFDPDFFLYYEETELIHRIARQGGEVWHVPEALIGHVAGAATGMEGGRSRNRTQPCYWYDSWRLYFVKTAGVAGARRVAVAKYTAALLNVALRRLSGSRPDAPENFGPDFRRHVLAPLFLGDPLESRPDGRTLKADWLNRSRA